MNFTTGSTLLAISLFGHRSCSSDLETMALPPKSNVSAVAKDESGLWKCNICIGFDL